MSLELEERLVAKANQAKIPLTVNFELTPICNLGCDMCFIRTEKSIVDKLGGLHTVEEWLDIAREFKKMGTLFILLTGGEPMLYPGFKELYAELKKMGFILTINTNGTMIDEPMAQFFHEYTPRRVNVTLYGPDRDYYQRLTHHADGFDRCMRGLKLLRQYNIDTKMNISLVKSNEGTHQQLLQIAKDLDIPAVTNSYMFPCMRSNCAGKRHIVDERLDPETAAFESVEFMKYKREDEFELYAKEIHHIIEQYEPRPIGLDCRAASSSCWVNWQQQLSPCVMLEAPRFDLHQVPVPEAWQQLVTASTELPKHEECAECKLKLVCEVCYAGAAHEKKVCGNVDYLCRMAHKKVEILEQEVKHEKNS